MHFHISHMFLYITVSEAKTLAPVTKVRGDDKKVSWVIQEGPQETPIQGFTAARKVSLSHSLTQAASQSHAACLLGLTAPTMMGTSLKGCSLQHAAVPQVAEMYRFLPV